MSRAVSPIGSTGSLAARPQPSFVTPSGLVVRPWSADRSDDVAAVLVAFADPEIQRWGLRDVSTPAQARAWLDGWHRTWQAETDACWAVERRGVVAGRVALGRLDLAAGIAEVSYWVLPDARGRGVASEGTAELARWAFEEVGLRRLELCHSVHNEASCRVARRIGFPLEETLRDGMLHVDGWHDLHRHARQAPTSPSPRVTLCP